MRGFGERGTLPAAATPLLAQIRGLESGERPRAAVVAPPAEFAAAAEPPRDVAVSAVAPDEITGSAQEAPTGNAGGSAVRRAGRPSRAEEFEPKLMAPPSARIVVESRKSAAHRSAGREAYRGASGDGRAWTRIFWDTMLNNCR